MLEHVRRVAKERAVGITLDSSIVELGLDSLERMEIIASLEETFGGRFPEDVLTADRNLPRSGRRGRNLPGHDAASQEPSAATDREIPPENYRFEQFPEYLKLRQQMRRDRTPPAS